MAFDLLLVVLIHQKKEPEPWDEDTMRTVEFENQTSIFHPDNTSCPSRTSQTKSMSKMSNLRI